MSTRPIYTEQVEKILKTGGRYGMGGELELRPTATMRRPTLSKLRDGEKCCLAGSQIAAQNAHNAARTNVARKRKSGNGGTFCH